MYAESSLMLAALKVILLAPGFKVAVNCGVVAPVFTLAQLPSNLKVAVTGDEIGIKVNEHVREGDIVYKVIEE